MAKFKFNIISINLSNNRNRVSKICSLIAKIYMIISIYMAPSPYIQLHQCWACRSTDIENWVIIAHQIELSTAKVPNLQRFEMTAMIQALINIQPMTRIWYLNIYLIYNINIYIRISKFYPLWPLVERINIIFK